ncbi:hypothetical protein N9C66_00190 [Akkermansiaceae bacterium]|nr:hypothetical protein [Akkermansiaceae bacterium]MDA9829731.1 hypothetical protein [Akkermansiaceae bacterium]MDB4370434.1 hypothetical protein [Akkermansiaceae bacterium]MDB4384398.1 hypothetical protein [Akkermansiaceae bacterium]
MGKGFQILLVLVFVSAACFFGGPWMIHRAYRLTTSEAERDGSKIRYHRLASSERLAEGAELVEMRVERMRLYYWFHARGWAIDEGDHEEHRPWRELFNHWGNS